MSGLRVSIQPPDGPRAERDCDTGTLTLGRGADCDVVISDHSVSRRHARIESDGDGWVVEDLGARNGTFLDGTRISGRHALSNGSVITIGGTVVRVSLAGSEPATTLGEGATASVFRPVSELRAEPLESDGAAPSRVAARLQALNDFHRALAGPIALDALLELLLERLFAALHPEEGVILLRQRDGTLATAASRRLPGARGELLVSRSLISEVVDKSTAALVSDLATDSRFAGAESIVGAGIRSILAAPISDASGCVGMVAVYSRVRVRSFGEEDLELLVSLAGAAALRIRNVALAEAAAERRVQDHELALAHDIQMAMVPRQFPQRPEVEMAAALVPARAVGGDLYDFLVIEDALWFIVADAAGKGVSAALFMAVTRTLFRAVVQSVPSVAAVLTRMNMELARDNERQFFVTAIVGRLDLGSGALTYGTAGHPPPLLAAGGHEPGPVEPVDGGIALGILDDAAYTEREVTLSAGDVLLVFTDGVTDAINKHGALFSDARVHGNFATSAAGPISLIPSGLVAAVTTFAAGQPQEDDITILALRYTGCHAPGGSKT